MKHRTLISSTLIEYTRLTYFPENISGNVTGNFRNSDSEGTLFYKFTNFPKDQKQPPEVFCKNKCS